ncbi:MAG TPA: hypothetical protein VN999_12895 [Thermoanaerobaculia bacterium]|nr:hypothetical protein [Thermoanaerobaculia bacterium]
MDILTDREIQELIAEPKQLPTDFGLVALKTRRGSRFAGIDFATTAGNKYFIFLRQSLYNPLAFSAGLGYHLSTRDFRLKRYNGKFHEHTNPLEHETFYDFHIHMATERYQLRGNREDCYAERAGQRFGSLKDAFYCLMDDCNVVLPGPPEQRSLFRT